jgi:hypothetical protein
VCSTNPNGKNWAVMKVIGRDEQSRLINRCVNDGEKKVLSPTTSERTIEGEELLPKKTFFSAKRVKRREKVFNLFRKQKLFFANRCDNVEIVLKSLPAPKYHLLQDYDNRRNGCQWGRCSHQVQMS